MVYANYLGLLPSVAQPPCPLQEFLLLQPLSPDLQPPCPLQEFCPLQEWVPLSAGVWIDVPGDPVLLEVLAAIAAEPLRSPAIAAPRIAVFVVFCMVCLFFWFS